MPQLSWAECAFLQAPLAVAAPGKPHSLRSHVVILKRGQHVKHRPYAFAEQGVAMLSIVLWSRKAIRVNVEIMRAFVRVRQMLVPHADLARRVDALEEKYDGQFKVVYTAIRDLMASPPEPPRGRIGFHRAHEGGHP